MPRLLQFVVLSVCLLASSPARAFSLLGVIESWQTGTIGYAAGGDIGAPKNLTEEYRWNTPVITYAFDNSFLTYFGTNGVKAVDEAFAVINSLPDLSSLDPTLPDYPLTDPATGAISSYQDSRR